MDVFFDTEFTSLGDKLNAPYLISLGCVAADGREFYAELSDTYHVGLCSEFVQQTVLPLLNGGACKMMEAQLAVRFREWVEGLGEEEVIMRCDAPRYDWPFVATMCQFYGTWPKNLRRKCGVISFRDHRQAHRFNLGAEMYWKENAARQHHALVDARGMRFAWKFSNRRGM